jgi:hypothetical protein
MEHPHSKEKQQQQKPTKNAATGKEGGINVRRKRIYICLTMTYPVRMNREVLGTIRGTNDTVMYLSKGKRTD